MPLHDRLNRIEKRVAPPRPNNCASCGLALPGARSAGPASITVSWHAPGDPVPEPCPACGQTGVIWVEFDHAG
jgi:hypothetical protein